MRRYDAQYDAQDAANADERVRRALEDENGYWQGAAIRYVTIYERAKRAGYRVGASNAAVVPGR